MSKPASKPGWIPGNEAEYIEDPGSTKTNGWVDATPAPNLQFNWFWNLVSQWINFMDEITRANDGLNVVADANLRFHGSSYESDLYMNATGSQMIWAPLTDNVTDLYIGTGSLTWKDLYLQAQGEMNIVGNVLDIDAVASSTFDVGTTMAFTAGGTLITISGDDTTIKSDTTDTDDLFLGTSGVQWKDVELNASNSLIIDTDTIIWRQDGISTVNFIPSTDAQKTLNFGTGSYQWNYFNVDTSSTIGLDAGTTVVIAAGTGMTIDTGTFLDIDATTYLDFTSTTNFEISAGTTMNIDSAGVMKIDSASTLELESSSTMTLDSGGAIDASAHGNVGLSPDTDDSYTLDIGTTSLRYTYARIKAVSAISFADSDSTGGVIVNLTGDDFSPIVTDESWDLGTGPAAWGTIYRNAEASPSELYFADSWKDPKTGTIETLNDLELLCGIKGRGIHDKRQGFELVDDSTLPDCILFRNKKTGKIEFNKKGQPYSDMDGLTALCVGAIRQLKLEIDTIKWESKNK